MTQLSVFIGLLLAASPSQATYSIVATDRETNYIGGAGASCVQNLDIGAALYRGVPGKGVLHTQAVVIDVDSEAVTTALSLVGTAGTPDEILAKMNELDSGTEITDFYELPGPEFEIRQNAIADLNGLHGAWTGTQINDLYESDGTFGTTQEDAGGSDDRFAYSAQGNVVTNNTVALLQMGFTTGLLDNDLAGCDLPARLIIAMEAVPLAGGGDARCIRADLSPNDVSGTPAAGAFVKVQDAEGNFIIDINVIDDGQVDQTIELKAKYDEWRAANPCPDEQGTASPTNPPTNSETETTTTSGPAVDTPPAPTDEPTNPPSGASFVKSIISVFSSSVVAAVLLLN